MATKIAPKTIEKEAKKAGAKEVEAQARLKVMEKSVTVLLKPVEAYLEAEQGVVQAEYEIIDTLKEEVQKHEYTQAEASKVIKKALYEGRKLDMEKDKNPSLNSKVSRYVNLLGLYDKEINGKTVKAEVLAKRIAEGFEKNLPIADMHRVASGSLLPKDAVSKKPKANQYTGSKDENLVNGKKAITDATVLGNELGALIRRANQGKVPDDEIIATLVEQYFFARRTLDESVSDETLQEEVIVAGEVALTNVNKQQD